MTEKPKVICLGLARTGTSSLRDALQILGFSPAYHMKTILQGGDPTEFDKWQQFAEGSGSIKLIHKLLDEYEAILDYPSVMFPDELYAAYPDAKFILTTRDPETWKKSIESTVLWVPEVLSSAQSLPPVVSRLVRFRLEIIQGWYHSGRLPADAPGELVRHNERVKTIIPPKQLLIYQVGEGWDRLIEYLGVPKPDEPFPHINDTAEFRKRYEGLRDGAGVVFED